MFIGYEEKSDKLHSYKLLYKLNSSLSLSERNQLVYSDHIISLCIFQQKTNFQKLRGFFEHANLPDTMDVLFRFVKTMLLLDVFRLEKKQMLARAIQRTLEFGVRMNIQTTRYNRRPVQICEDQMEFSANSKNTSKI